MVTKQHHEYRKGSTLHVLIRRMASAAWQASGEGAPVDHNKWMNIARATYDELLKFDAEPKPVEPRGEDYNWYGRHDFGFIEYEDANASAG